MASGRFEITVDRASKLLSMRFHGFFTMADLAGYLDAKRSALARLGCAPNDHVTICDFSACGPQSQDVLRFLAASLDDPEHMSRRLAVVVSSALARLQAQRILSRPGAGCFDRWDDALEWLKASGQDTADLPAR